MIDDEHRGLSVAGARFVLVDGRVAATWTFERSNGSPTLSITTLAPIPKRHRDAVAEEAERLLTFLADGERGTVTFAAAS